MNNTVRLAPLPTIKELLKIYNVTALKRLSQNFLLDLRLMDKIVKAAGNLGGAEVCEVGPGPGGITRSILKCSPSKVILIEKDVRFQPILENLAEASYTTVNVIYGDVLNFNMSETFSPHLKENWDGHTPKINLIGNLPFSVSTPLIMKWMKDIYFRRSAWSYGRVQMTLTFQEEVARRIVAPPFAKERCRMSVMCQNYCDVHFKLVIPGKAFLPKPDVNVGVVHLVPLKKSLIPLDVNHLEKVLRVLFSTKQKFLKKTTINLFPKEVAKDLSSELLARANVSEVLRAYQLSNDEWKRLCDAYKVICDRDPRLYSYNYRGDKRSRETEWQMENGETDEEDAYEQESST